MSPSALPVGAYAAARATSPSAARNERRRRACSAAGTAAKRATSSSRPRRQQNCMTSQLSSLSRSLKWVGASLGLAAAAGAHTMQNVPAHHLSSRWAPLLWGPRFQNPWPTWPGDKSLGDVWRFMLLMNELRVPNYGYLSNNRKPSLQDCSRVFPLVPPDAPALAAPPPDAIQALWVGHATTLVQMEGFTFMTDPFFSQRSSPWQAFGPQRAVQPALVPEDAAMPALDFVLISHNHYDHLDLGSVTRLHKRFGPGLAWYVPLGLAGWFAGLGITNVTELDWWQEVQHPGSKVRVALTPSQHWSARGMLDRRASLWGGWAVLGEQLRFWFAGDTGYCSVFPEIGARLGPFDLSAIPIGAYEPREFMRPMHIDPAEAVQVHKDVRSKRSIGVHCCTFFLTTEPLDEPPKLLQHHMEKQQLAADEFVTLRHGSMIVTAGGRDHNSPLLLPLCEEPAAPPG